MDELARSLPSQSSSNSSASSHQQAVQKRVAHDEVPPNGTTHFDNFGLRRSVKFDEEETSRSVPLALTAQRAASITRRNNGLPPTLRPLAEARLYAPARDYAKGKFLSICPREELTLNHISGEIDMVDVVVLKNESVRNVVYKIKITSPEKFRVRPSTGSVGPGATEFIRVYLQNEFRSSVSREKFLLMAVETNGENNEDFGTAWKHSSEETRMEHRLRCRLPGENEMTASLVAGTSDSATAVSTNDLPTDRTVSIVKSLQAEAAYRQNIIIISMGFIIVLQLLSLIWQHRYFVSILNTQKEFCSKSSSPPPNNPPFFDSDL